MTFDPKQAGKRTSGADTGVISPPLAAQNMDLPWNFYWDDKFGGGCGTTDHLL